jgi:hypothetical protein
MGDVNDTDHPLTITSLSDTTTANEAESTPTS